MSPEYLLSPRIKIIAHWPNMNSGWPTELKVGRVLSEPNIGWCKNVLGFDPVDYPHLFKPLQWWEEREEKDMPGYLKRYEKIYKVDRLDKDVEGEFFYILKSKMNGAKDWYPQNTNVSPATESEYNEYISKKTTSY